MLATMSTLYASHGPDNGEAVPCVVLLFAEPILGKLARAFPTGVEIVSRADPSCSFFGKPHLQSPNTAAIMSTL
jgi:hypothetical protein